MTSNKTHQEKHRMAFSVPHEMYLIASKSIPYLYSYNNNNNNNNHDNVYGAVIVLRALREFTRFTRCMQQQRQVAADLWTKPTDLTHRPACRQLRNYIHHRHLLLSLSSKADTHFTVPQRVEG